MAQHDQVQARLALLAATTRDPGWVPAAPTEPSPVDPPSGSRPEVDADELPTTWERVLPEADAVGGLPAIRERALVSAMAAYTAAHGHQLDATELAGDERSRRWATRRRVAVVATAALLVLGGAVTLHAVQQTPSVVVPVDSGVVPVDPDDPDAVASAPTAEVPEVVVHVVGEVARPGLVRLPGGSRLADAIDAAGGPGPDADLAAVNLARILTDGEQVTVPRPGEVVAQAAQPSDTGAIDLNAAGVGELDALPGIGPVLAQRIVDWRSDHGGFTSVDELAEVSGIGPTLLGRVRDLVRVG